MNDRQETIVDRGSIFRDLLLLLPLLSSEKDWSYRTRSTEVGRIEGYARWFIHIRWIAVLVAAVLVLITVKVAHVLPPEVGWPLFLSVVSLAGCNVLFILLVRGRRCTKHLLSSQVYVDLGMLTVLLHFSGGVENPLYPLAVFHVMIGGILLTRRQCYGVAALAGVLFSLLIWMEWGGLIDHYPLLIFPYHGIHGSLSDSLHNILLRGEVMSSVAQHTLYVGGVMGVQLILLFLTAYFVTTLAEQGRRKERQLEGFADYALAERQLLEKALETTGTGLRVLDRDLQPYWINNRWKEWFASLAPESLQPVQRADSPTALPGSAKQRGEEGIPAWQTLQDGAVRITEYVLPEVGDHLCGLSQQRQARILQVTTAPLVDRSDHISHVVELAQDVTQQRHIQAQLTQAGKMAAIGELAGHIAHEVNNPIAIISAKSRLLLSDHKGGMSDKISRELGKIVDLSDRIASIVHGLLSYCRPAAPTRTLLDLRISIERSVSIVEQRARANGTKIECRLPNQPLVVWANPNEMEQVFLNLLLNALDAMPDGGRLVVSILGDGVRLTDGKSGVAVIVEDTGPGVPEEIRERIFEPFFTTKEEGHGTGLGLSICLGLVQSHGGEIMVDSVPGRGTRFTVKLPLEVGSERGGIPHA